MWREHIPRFRLRIACKLLHRPPLNRRLAFGFAEVIQATDQVYSLRDFNLPNDIPETPRHLREGRASHPQLANRNAVGRTRSALARGDSTPCVGPRGDDSSLSRF